MIGTTQTPFARLEPTQVHLAEKQHLIAVSRAIEARAAHAQGLVRAWACLQRAEHVSPLTRSVYEQLAAGGVAVRLFAVGLKQRDWPSGVTVHDLAESDPLVNEWVVAFLSPDDGYALAASEVNRSYETPDLQRPFRWGIAPDRDSALRVVMDLP